MTKAKKQKLSQEMKTARKDAIAKQKIASLGLNAEDIMPKLKEKMGDYAADFVTEAMSRPGYLVNRTGEPFQKSKALITTYANEEIDDKRLAQALGATTSRDITAKSAQIQESVANYKMQQITIKTSEPETDIRDAVVTKQKQAEARIDQHTAQAAALDRVVQQETEAKSAVLTPTTQETSSAVLTPKNQEQSAPVAATTQSAVLQPTETTGSKSNPLGFKFESATQISFDENGLAPWSAASRATQDATPQPSNPTPQANEQAMTPLDPQKAAEKLQAEESARQQAQEELARLKEGKNGELTLAELQNNGISSDIMKQTITKDNLGEIHAGPTAQKMADNCIKAAKSMWSVGKCARGYGKAEKDTTGVRYQTQIPTLRKNGANMDSAWENSSNRVVFDFDSDKKNGNPEILQCDIGTSVNFDGAAKKIVRNGKIITQPDGHVSTKGTDGNWYSDHHDTDSWLAGRGAANRYGDQYHVSFYTDCTASDKLAEDMLYQKYLREAENQKDVNQTTNAQQQTTTAQQAQQMAMLQVAQNSR